MFGPRNLRHGSIMLARGLQFAGITCSSTWKIAWMISGTSGIIQSINFSHDIQIQSPGLMGGCITMIGIYSNDTDRWVYMVMWYGNAREWPRDVGQVWVW